MPSKQEIMAKAAILLVEELVTTGFECVATTEKYSQAYRLTNSKLGLCCIISYDIGAAAYANTIFWEIRERTSKGGYANRSDGHTYFTDIEAENTKSVNITLDMLRRAISKSGTPLADVRRTLASDVETIYLQPFSFSLAPRFQATNTGVVVFSMLLNSAKVLHMGILTTANKRKRTAFQRGGATDPDADVWFLMDCTHSYQHIYIITNGLGWYPAYGSMANGHEQVVIPDDPNFAHGRSNSVILTAETLTIHDQALIQTAISYYVAGNI